MSQFGRRQFLQIAGLFVLATGPASAQLAEPSKSQAEAATLYRQGHALEGAGNVKDAVRIYRQAARAGSGKAAMRLGEIFDKGAPGVSRDYRESLQWYETAYKLGEARDGGWGCPPKCDRQR